MIKPEYKPPDNPLVCYQIKVKGHLHEKWSDWFGGLEIELERMPDGSNITVLQGPVKDQAALRGVLVKLLDLNLVLISMQQIHPSLEDENTSRK